MNTLFLVGGIIAIIVAGGQFLVYNRTTSSYIQAVAVITAIISFLAGLGLVVMGLAQ